MNTLMECVREKDTLERTNKRMNDLITLVDSCSRCQYVNTARCNCSFSVPTRNFFLSFILST